MSISYALWYIIMKSKLWQTSASLDKLVEKFTVGDDYIVDIAFLRYDIEASRAHAKMLAKIWVISEEELIMALEGFDEILSKHEKGEFVIDPSQEDGHTAIEGYLTERFGDVGKKIHTGRSRNDQSLTMIRLFLKENYEESLLLISDFIGAFETRLKEPVLEMPWYTHWQKAMPTTSHIWLGSFRDALQDIEFILGSQRTVFDQSPLWSAAGFWIHSFPNDREYSSKLLGFAKVQENPMYCGLSRWLFEYEFLSQLGSVLLVISRLNTDLLLFTTSEFGFVSLPNTMTTGSSIMPQKRNYDVCELIRAKISIYFGYVDQLRNIYTHLMSGYQRDLQMTKSILLNAMSTWNDILEVSVLIVSSVEFHEDTLKKSLSEDLYATDEVYKLVAQGMAFRDAYKIIKWKF